uniref:Putative lipocalin-5 1 n=1 Tax=Amblyomma triste TaxID=251400 RepID=A0A023GCI2_AMBTT
MGTLALFAVVAACSANAAASAEVNEDKLDPFKLWSAFPDAIAVTSSTHSRLFECAEVTRLALDTDSKTADYDFYFASTGRRMTFHLAEGDSPGSVIFTVGSDPNPSTAAFYYSDFKTCAVISMKFIGNECILLVKKGLNESLPESCIDNYEEDCGVEIPKDSKLPCID